LAGGAGLTAAEGGARACEQRWATWAARGEESAARGREKRRLGRIRPSRGDFPFSFFYLLFLFLFMLSPFSFEKIFSYIFLSAKKYILCEVLLTIIVYAFDEMSYEVESRE
jgi:hypothetical protein